MPPDPQDRHELTDLVYRLGACLDEHRFDDLAQLFTEDATATTPGGPAAGRDAVLAQATRNHAEFPHLQHVVTNPLVEVDGDRAAIRANIVGTFARAFGPPDRVIGGVYRFSARRTGDGWSLDGLEVRPVWLVGEAPPAPARAA